MTPAQEIERLRNAFLLILEQEGKAGPYNPVIEHAKIALKCAICDGTGMAVAWQDGRLEDIKCETCDGAGWHL